MHLKRLDIVGFKSFADPVKLDLERGITAVVGPNGCGKSNIIDAVRWCLGEMSAKSLRSNLMLDVVFNGSGARPPQNMSEVTLSFDNSDRKLPIDYTDVSITRRLFRSGESEYFINKTQCRLRDIKDLFLDTGMGEDGYACIEQGKVEWLLQSKPEERRELFEEAAGISKYRARREEAIRKLDRVEIDLSRINDIVAVTQDQIRRLENAVNKAKIYQRVRDDLKNMEISDWLSKRLEIDDELSGLHERLNDVNKKAEEQNTLIHKSDSELAQQRLEMTQTEEDLLQANGTLASIDADIKIGEERLANFKRREAELAKQLEQTSQIHELEKTRISGLIQQETEQKQTLDHQRAEGASIVEDYESSQQNFQLSLKNLEDKKTEVKESRDLMLDRAQEHSRIQQEISNISSALSRSESQQESRKKEHQRLAQERDQAHLLATERQKAVGDYQVQLDAKIQILEGQSHRLNDFKERESEFRTHLLAYSEEIAQLKGQIKSIENHQKTDPYHSGTQSLISAGVAGISGPLGKMIQTAENDLDLIATALGETLGDLVADTAHDAQQAIEVLEATQKGRARIWILEKVPSVSRETLVANASNDQLIDHIQCDEKFKPLIRFLLSSLWVQGATIYGNAFINGGVDPHKWQSHIPLRLPELRKACEGKQNLKIELEDALNDQLLEEAQLLNQRESTVKEIEEFKIRLEMAREEGEKGLKKRALLNEEIGVVETEIERQRRDIESLKTRLEENENRHHVLQKLEEDHHHQLDILQHDLTEMQNSHSQTSADSAATTERHNSFQEKLQWRESILVQTQNEIKDLKDRLVHHEESIRDYEAEKSQAQSSQADAQEMIESSLSKRRGASDQVSLIQAQRTRMSERIEASQRGLNQLREDLSKTHEIIQNERIQETTLHERSESLVQKLADQYEMTLAEAKEHFQPVEANMEALEKLKKRVSNMGPVNLAAPQEHAELLEKNEFLIKQQTDLIQAKEDLRQVIHKINATTREHFKETFYKVRENFRALYSKLFQGGEADLHFTNEADILTTGVDIFCQPPGKKLTHISLLSGGEKALTAVALLFAFFEVRPSPVALLDEIDAPLDEANILRFVDLIRIYSEKSQFLVITHNKRTMEAGHTLYGVTMEDFGVSKIISARLEKAKEAPVGAQPVHA